MKKLSCHLGLVAAMTMLSACGSNISTKTHDEVDQIVRQKEDDLNKIPVPDAEFLKSKPSQPGSVTVSGVLVKADGRLVSEVSVDLKAGRDCEGRAVALDDSSKVITKTAPATEILKDIEKDATLIAIGECNPAVVKNFAGLDSLTVKKLELKADLLNVVRARTILLCGKVDLKKTLLQFVAHRLMFSNVEYSQRASVGFSLFYANELYVSGANTLSVRGGDGDAVTGSLGVSVASEFAPEKGAILRLQSAGGDAKKSEK